MVELEDMAIYKAFDELEPLLRNGVAMWNDSTSEETNGFQKIFEDPEFATKFFFGMAAYSKGHFAALAQKFDFSPY
jgi:hypothetical protein